MFDSVITTTAEQAGELHRDREHAHAAMLSLWHQRTGSTTRAAVGAVWAVTCADVLTETGEVLVRSAVPLERTPAWAHDIATINRSDYEPAEGDQLQLTIELETGRTPHVPVPRELERALKQGADGTPRPPGKGLAFRARREAVPTDELTTWAGPKLARNGITAQAVSVLRTGQLRLPKHRTVHPVATLAITGTVNDPDTYRTSLATGIGKGKGFGLGLLIEQSMSTA